MKSRVTELIRRAGISFKLHVNLKKNIYLRALKLKNMFRVRFAPKTEKFKLYFIEMILIITSVFLAFFINEIRNNYQENKKLATSLKFIEEEMLQNQAYITEYVLAHEIIKDRLDSLIKNDIYEGTYDSYHGFSIHHIYPKSFFNQLLSRQAWDIAVNNNIFNQLKIEDVVIISRAYEQQKLVMDAAYDISKFMQSEAVFNEDLTKNNCQVMRCRFRTLHGFEMRLIYNYQEALKVLERIRE